MFYRTFSAFWGTVFLELITVSVRGFPVPTICSFKRFSLWASVSIGALIVLEFGDQIILCCAVFVTCSLFGLCYNCGNVGLLADFYLFAIMVTFIYQCGVSFDT